MNQRVSKVLNLWFTPTWDRHLEAVPSELSRLWWGSKDEADQKTIDQQLRNDFLDDILNHESTMKWSSEPQGKLAIIILYDQLVRNVFRKQKEAFEYEKFTLPLTKELINSKEDLKYKYYERLFLYLPLEHSEKMEDQELAVKKFKELAKEAQDSNNPNASAMKDLEKFALWHYEIVKSFGRFPHRNKVLGRQSTEKEIEYLNNGGQSFGQ